MDNTPARTGRPPRAGMRSDCRVEFGVTGEELRALRRLAERNQQPLATFIRDVVNEAAAECGERAVFFTADS